MAKRKIVVSLINTANRENGTYVRSENAKSYRVEVENRSDRSQHVHVGGVARRAVVRAVGKEEGTYYTALIDVASERRQRTISDMNAQRRKS
jgi:hypothetical protein